MSNRDNNSNTSSGSVTKKIFLKKSTSTDFDHTRKLKSKLRKINISEEIDANVIIFKSLSSLDQQHIDKDEKPTAKCTTTASGGGGGELKKGFFKSKLKTLRKINDGKSGSKIPASPSISIDGSSIKYPLDSTSSCSTVSVSSGSGACGTKPKTSRTPSNFVRKLTNLNKKNKIKDTTGQKSPKVLNLSGSSQTPSPVRRIAGEIRRYGTTVPDENDDGGTVFTIQVPKPMQTHTSLSELGLHEIDDAIANKNNNNNNDIVSNNNGYNNKNGSKKNIFMVSSDSENNNIRLPVEPQHNNDHITTFGGHITSNNRMNNIEMDCNMMSRAVSSNVINKLDIVPATSTYHSDNNLSDRRSIKTLRDEFFDTFKLNTSGFGGLGNTSAHGSHSSGFGEVNTSLDRDLLKIIEKSDFKDESRHCDYISDEQRLENLRKEPEEIYHSEDDDFNSRLNIIEFNIGKTVNRPPKLLYPIKYNESTDIAILLKNTDLPTTTSEPQSATSSFPSIRRKISFNQPHEEDEIDGDSEDASINEKSISSRDSSLNVASDGEFMSTGAYYENSLNYLKILSEYSLDYTDYKGGCCDIVVSKIMTPLPMPHGDLITSDDMITTNTMTSHPTASTSNSTASSSSMVTGAAATSSSSSSNTMAHGNGGANIMSLEKREYLYKILVIGELGTGKTSFIRRYVHNFFSQNYRATIGVDFALKVLNWDQKSIIRLQLWDIAGQERFGNMTRVYYKEAAGAFIVFDVTRGATFDAVVKWKQDLDSKVQLPDGSPIPCILLANKCDQPKQGVANNSSKLDEYVKENGFAGWYETSAKDNINIEDAAKALVNRILQNDKLINSGVLIDNEKIALSGGNGGDSNGNGDSQTKKNCLQC